MKREGFFALPTFLTTSSLQFISSTGECSMLGQVDHDSKVFIAHNLDKLKVDFARGRGEYAMAFASIYGCNREGQLLFPSLLKSKFSEVVKKEEDLEDVHKMLVNEIRTNSYMVASCNI